MGLNELKLRINTVMLAMHSRQRTLAFPLFSLQGCYPTTLSLHLQTYLITAPQWKSTHSKRLITSFPTICIPLFILKTF